MSNGTHTNLNTNLSTNQLETQLKEMLGMPATIESPARTSVGLMHADLSHAIIGAAIEVHRHIGPGQLESVYQRALAQELAERTIAFRAQAPIAMTYKGACVGEFFADFIVERKIILELKAVDRLHPAHTAQMLSYLRSTGLHLGLLINFNMPTLVHGVKRLVL